MQPYLPQDWTSNYHASLSFVRQHVALLVHYHEEKLGIASIQKPMDEWNDITFCWTES